MEGAIVISEDQSKTVFYNPHTLIIKAGGEILIANNAKSNQSVTSGFGPNDPFAGTIK